MSKPASATALAVLFALTGTRISAAPPSSEERLKRDPRLQQTLTVRVSRMPLADLLRRLDTELGVRLAARGEDVADQKVDLFTHGEAVSAAEILLAISRLLNSEGPKGYYWERLGQAPQYRYGLVRDVASRHWEERQARAAEQRLARQLRAKLAALGKDPFRPDPARPLELPSMRQFLATLSNEQVERLLADRLLMVSAIDCGPVQKPLLRQLVEQMAFEPGGRYVRGQRLAGWSAARPDKEVRARVLLLGDPPQYRVAVGIGALGLGQQSEVFRVGDERPTAQPPQRPRVDVTSLLAGGKEPVFALAPRSSWLTKEGLTVSDDGSFRPAPRSAWLMGDVLADIAARAHLNLIADDYTETWFHAPPTSSYVAYGEDGQAERQAMAMLADYRSAQPLSVWLGAIRDLYGFEPVREGQFLRLRNRHWWLDQRREIAPRLLTRWAGALRGSASDRLPAAVEIAGLAPLSPNPYLLWDRLQVFSQSPEVAGVLFSDRTLTLSFAETLAYAQSGLLMYGALPPPLQREVCQAGLQLSWQQMPPAFRELFRREVKYTGASEEELRDCSAFFQFKDNLFRAEWRLAPTVIPEWPGWNPTQRVSLALHSTGDSARLVGQPLPELEIEDPSGRKIPLRPIGPLLLYVAPAWPRPAVTPGEAFPDLQALQQMADSEKHLLVVGTDATAAELAGWWKARGVTPLPRALRPESGDRFGMRHLPLVLVVGRDGRITWVKEGYSPGDAAEWRRQLAATGG